jgi:hypothetical protein
MWVMPSVGDGGAGQRACTVCDVSYQQQPAYYLPVPAPSNGQATAAMVVGIVAAAIGVWSVIPVIGIGAAFLAFLPAVLAVIFGHTGLNRSKMLNGYGRVQALTGLWTGYGTIAIIVATVVFWTVAFAFSNANS